MLIIRLQRVGRRNHAQFRVVLTDSHNGPKSGNFIEILGSYNPHVNSVSLNGERIKEWIGNGAQVSDTVHNLLVSEKVIEGKKRNVLPRKSPPKKEEAPAAEAPAEAAPAEETPAEETAADASSETEPANA